MRTNLICLLPMVWAATLLLLSGPVSSAESPTSLQAGANERCAPRHFVIANARVACIPVERDDCLIIPSPLDLAQAKMPPCLSKPGWLLRLLRVRHVLISHTRAVRALPRPKAGLT